MTSETQTEWRRGGDPANPPIDKPGFYKRRTAENGVVSKGHYFFLEGGHSEFWREDGSKVGTVSPFFWNTDRNHEWLYVGIDAPAIGPLPVEQSEPYMPKHRTYRHVDTLPHADCASPATCDCDCEGCKRSRGGFTAKGQDEFMAACKVDGEQSGKGDREAFNAAYAKWSQESGRTVVAFSGLDFTFICSPAGRAALEKLLGVKFNHSEIDGGNWWPDNAPSPQQMARQLEAERDSLASQLEEARKECDDAHDALDKAKAAISRKNPLADRIIQLVGARDEWKAIANSRRISNRELTNKVAQLSRLSPVKTDAETEPSEAFVKSKVYCLEIVNDWLLSKLTPCPERRSNG